MTILSASKPGPWTGVVLDKVTEWQLDHPNGTKEECGTWLKAQQAAGKIAINLANGGLSKALDPKDSCPGNGQGPSKRTKTR